VAHGVTTFFLSKLELAVEAFDGHEGVLYGGLHGNPGLFPIKTKKINEFIDLCLKLQ